MVRGKYGLRYGLQLEILGIRPALTPTFAKALTFPIWSRVASITRTICSRRSARSSIARSTIPVSDAWSS